MGIVWEAYHKGVPLLGVLGITLEIVQYFMAIIIYMDTPSFTKRTKKNHPKNWCFFNKNQYIEILQAATLAAKCLGLFRGIVVVLLGSLKKKNRRGLPTGQTPWPPHWPTLRPHLSPLLVDHKERHSHDPTNEASPQGCNGGRGRRERVWTHPPFGRLGAIGTTS